MSNSKTAVGFSSFFTSERFRLCRWWKSEKVVDGLKEVYKSKLLPLEERHGFHHFHSPKLNDSDFESKPFILLMGQYSTGKTTLIRYLLGSDFPGMRIGPEPTTDKFMAIMYDDQARVIPGNALVADPKKPFGPLVKYGNAFLTKFQCSTLKNQVLEGLNLVDTPGILSGEKQRVDRGYDFTGVLHWFAERVDRIILLFDAHKLDISDEFKRSIEAIRGHEEKILILLNKADMVNHQSLMRIYGSLMWSLDKVFNTPEVPRVFVGSFWDHSLKNSVNKQLFQDEERDLFREMQLLPRNATLRKLNDLTKRTRSARVHAYITDTLSRNMPLFFGKDHEKRILLDNLNAIFEKLQKDLSLAPGDFPDPKVLKDLLKEQDFSKFRKIDRRQMAAVDEMLTVDIARLMAMIPNDESGALSEITVGALSQVSDKLPPFSCKIDVGFNAGRDACWIVETNREKYDKLFSELQPDENGKLERSVAKAEFIKSNLPPNILSKLYSLADVDDDGLLDKDEFALAKYMIQLLNEGFALPDDLPKHLVPPSKSVPFNK